MIPLEHYILLSVFLFAMGIVIMVVKKNAIMVLMGIELILNAANLNLVAFSQNDTALQGQFFSLFVIIVATAEAAIALAIVLKLVKGGASTSLDESTKLKG